MKKKKTTVSNFSFHVIYVWMCWCRVHRSSLPKKLQIASMPDAFSCHFFLTCSFSVIYFWMCWFRIHTSALPKKLQNANMYAWCLFFFTMNQMQENNLFVVSFLCTKHITCRNKKFTTKFSNRVLWFISTCVDCVYAEPLCQRRCRVWVCPVPQFWVFRLADLFLHVFLFLYFVISYSQIHAAKEVAGCEYAFFFFVFYVFLFADSRCQRRCRFLMPHLFRLFFFLLLLCRFTMPKKLQNASTSVYSVL